VEVVEGVVTSSLSPPPSSTNGALLEAVVVMVLEVVLNSSDGWRSLLSLLPLLLPAFRDLPLDEGSLESPSSPPSPSLSESESTASVVSTGTEIPPTPIASRDISSIRSIIAEIVLIEIIIIIIIMVTIIVIV